MRCDFSLLYLTVISRNHWHSKGFRNGHFCKHLSFAAFSHIFVRQMCAKKSISNWDMDKTLGHFFAAEKVNAHGRYCVRGIISTVRQNVENISFMLYKSKLWVDMIGSPWMRNPAQKSCKVSLSLVLLLIGCHVPPLQMLQSTYTVWFA